MRKLSANKTKPPRKRLKKVSLMKRRTPKSPSLFARLKLKLYCSFPASMLVVTKKRNSLKLKNPTKLTRLCNKRRSLQTPTLNVAPKL